MAKPRCALTLTGFHLSATLRETNMNSLTKYELTFQQTTFHPVVHDNNAWLTSTELAQALGYADTKSVTKLFTRNSDEFTPAMSLVVEMTTNGINNSLRKKKVRVFSLRGAHLIAMFATTTVAKEFRRWVLDILDREVANSPIAKQFTDEELCDLAWLWRAGAVMITACRDVYPLLRVAEHSQAGRFCSIGQEYPRTLNKARQLLKRETSHIEHQPWRYDNWSRVLPHLRQEMLQ